MQVSDLGQYCMTQATWCGSQNRS